MHIKLFDDFGNEMASLQLSGSACDHVVLGFNPSGDKDVTVAKALAAAAITYAELMATQNLHPLAGRRFSLAKTEFETGAMYLVKGITTR